MIRQSGWGLLVASVLVGAPIPSASAGEENAATEANEADKSSDSPAEKPVVAAPAATATTPEDSAKPTAEATVEPTAEPTVEPNVEAAAAPPAASAEALTGTTKEASAPVAPTAAPLPSAVASSVASATAPAAAVPSAQAVPLAQGLSAKDAELVSRLAKEMAETRSYRRDASREQAWKFWGAVTRDANAREELKRHARRTARFRHVLRLAKAQQQQETAQRALMLLDGEMLRHERAMKALLKSNATKGTP